MSSLLEPLLTLPPAVAFAIIAGLIFAEAAVFVGFVLPGETAAVIGGFLAATGQISLPVLLAVVVIAAAAGDSVGYEVGRRFGPRVLASRLLRRYERRTAAARDLLRRRGGWAVFLGWFTAFLRAVTPGLAGASRMSYRRFLAFNLAGASVWGVGVSLLGYLAGDSYQDAEQLLGRSSVTLLLVLVTGGLILWHRHQKHHRVRRNQR